MPKPSTVRVRPLLPSDSVEEITHLLHRAYRRNAEAGLRFVATHQPSSVTANRLAAGRSFVAESEGRLAGVVTLRTDIECPYGDYAPPWPLASFGQFAVDPVYRGMGIGDVLLSRIEFEAQSPGVVELALDTAQPALALIAYYQARGYRIMGRADWRPVTNYESWVMAKRISPQL